MGLIVDNAITQNNALVLGNISVYSTISVENTTVHSVVGRVCTDGSSSSNYEDDMSFDKSIYNMFSKQDDMKTLVYPDRVRSEFDLYVQYAEAKTLGSVDVSFDGLDLYLGSIGVNDAVIC